LVSDLPGKTSATVWRSGWGSARRTFRKDWRYRSLVAVGYGKWRAFWIGSLTGLVEPMGGIVGAAAIWLAEPAIPIILGIAAGAMLFIISNEVIPETHRASGNVLVAHGRCTDALHGCCA
jgi:hypothetical protein